MKRIQTTLVVGFATILYVGTILAGFQVENLSTTWSLRKNWKGMGWQAPASSSIPRDALGESIRRGALIFNETPLYASEYTGARVSCSSCHAEGGMQPFASPVVGLPALFPMYSERAGRAISLEDRIEECFVRSENGVPIDYSGTLMKDIVDYIEWLSTPEPNRTAFQGRGLVHLPDLTPNPDRGRNIYTSQCAGCHGVHGEGVGNTFPPVWGPKSFNDGAGIHSVRKMAAFVQHNMPQNRSGILSPQEAYDVAAFLHGQPRPTLNAAYARY